MVAVIARFEVKEGHEAAFVAAATEMVDAVRANEPANQFYVLSKDRKRPNFFTILEKYDGLADFKAHGSSPWFTENFAKMKLFLVSEPIVELLEVLM